MQLRGWKGSTKGRRNSYKKVKSILLSVMRSASECWVARSERRCSEEDCITSAALLCPPPLT